MRTIYVRTILPHFYTLLSVIIPSLRATSLPPRATQVGLWSAVPTCVDLHVSMLQACRTLLWQNEASIKKAAKEFGIDRTQVKKVSEKYDEQKRRSGGAPGT